MGKHWGLQYKARMETFACAFVGTRLDLNDRKYAVDAAEKVLNEARVAYRNSSDIHSGRERALRCLMDMGPSGLARIEGETGPGMDVREFLVALDTPQGKRVIEE